MELDRTFAENHGFAALLSLLQGRPDEAESSLKRGLRLDPKSPSANYARSLMLAERGEPQAGKKLIERILTGCGIQNAAGIAETLVGFRPGQSALSRQTTPAHRPKKPIPTQEPPAAKVRRRKLH
jgi:hypothetical protein